MSNSSIRWAFNFSKWNPSYSDLLLAFSCIQPEEKDRLGRFVFKKDLKSSLVGRLLMRKFVNQTSDKKYNEILFVRDDKGKPILDKKENYPQLNFNVSHQGHYTVFAGEVGDVMLGVDVMKLEYTGGKALSDFFSLMTRHFSPQEWRTIKESSIEKQQIGMFCRLWCLKESYVKAIGVGITVSLQDISFKVNSLHLSKNYVVKDTELYVKGEKLNWTFEEMLLDDEHCVAVALSRNSNKDILFDELVFKDVVQNCVPLLPSDKNFTDNYFRKLDKL